jgi:hypothetical protein
MALVASRCVFVEVFFVVLLHLYQRNYSLISRLVVCVNGVSLSNPGWYRDDARPVFAVHGIANFELRLMKGVVMVSRGELRRFAGRDAECGRQERGYYYPVIGGEPSMSGMCSAQDVRTHSMSSVGNKRRVSIVECP